jgi:hypothetical protein
LTWFDVDDKAMGQDATVPRETLLHPLGSDRISTSPARSSPVPSDDDHRRFPTLKLPPLFAEEEGLLLLSFRRLSRSRPSPS